MSRSQRLRRCALVAAALLLAAGCGLKQGAVDQLKAQGGGAGGTSDLGGGGGTVGGGGGTVGGTTPSGGTVAGGTANGGGSGSIGGAAGGSAGSGGGTSGSGSTGGTTGTQTAKYERIGISGSVIRLGLHAPQTGAAPIPLQAFKTGTKLFWENHTIFGHKVVVDFLDDQYRTDVARQVCYQLSRQDFLVIGGAGSDQIQACGTDQDLIRSHTPYLSEGVTSNGLSNVPTYFAVTQTYAQQAPEVFANAAHLYPSQASGKWAIVTYSGPNFDDVTSAMSSVLRAHHVQFTVLRPARPGTQQSATGLVNQLRSYGAKTVFVVVSPNFWLDMLGAANETFTPAWVGPGVTMGENLVANVACQAQRTIKASFLSPFYGLDHEPSGFSSESNPRPDSLANERDIELDVYAVSEVIYRAMLAVGSIGNLTRDNFIASMAHFRANYGSGLTVYPTVAFDNNHFGGTGAWSEQLNCAREEFVTASWPRYLTP